MMTVQTRVGLTRLVVFAPKRRLDVAFPEQLPLVGLLPSLLRHAGEDLADKGVAHEGWALRRVDGSILDPGSTFAAQQVRDGETLHLVPRRLEWAEIAYDDIVDAIASGARHRGRRWTGAATRVAGLAAGGLALLAGLLTAALSGPPWTVPAATAIGVAAAAALAGTVLSRALADAAAGAVVAATAMPFAFLGGVLLFADEPLTRLGAPHLLTGSALLTTAGVLGYLGAAELGRLFVSGMVVGGSGMVAAAAGFTSFDGPEAAALIASAVLLVAPMLPAVAVRVGRIPLPQLPRTPDDLVTDEPLPDRRSVAAATARADETLTGLLFGVALANLVCFGVLVWSDRVAALLLTGAVSVAYLLRARFYVGIRHRIPLLLTGAGGLGLLGVLPQIAGTEGWVVAVLPAALGTAAVAVAAGLVYSRRLVSPRLGRVADILDVVLTLAVVPFACSVFGLFTYMRGFGG